jgi:hypothetical protein
MTSGDEWSPDEQLGTEVFEQGDEALDEASRVNPQFIEEVEEDPSLDPALQVDGRELEEVGAELDDPEVLATLDGGMDDPDGIDRPRSTRHNQEEELEGWELDGPLTKEPGTGGVSEE